MTTTIETLKEQLSQIQTAIETLENEPEDENKKAWGLETGRSYWYGSHSRFFFSKHYFDTILDFVNRYHNASEYNIVEAQDKDDWKNVRHGEYYAKANAKYCLISQNRLGYLIRAYMVGKRSVEQTTE